MSLKACFHRGGRPKIGEVTCGGSPHLSCKCDQIKMRDYMDRRVTPPKRVTSPTWGPPPPCKQALRKRVRAVSNFITLAPFHTSFLMLGNSSGVDSKELYLSSEKERENCCLASTSSIIKLETEEVSRRSRATIDGRKKVLKSVIHMQACCFAYLNLLRFRRSLCRRHHCHRCLSFLLAMVDGLFLILSFQDSKVFLF